MSRPRHFYRTLAVLVLRLGWCWIRIAWEWTLYQASWVRFGFLCWLARTTVAEELRRRRLAELTGAAA
jgi:hypothetical protein